MGFRCPECNIDFGSNRTALDKHLYDSPECGAIAYISLVGVDIASGKKKSKRRTKPKSTRTPRKKHSYVSEDHVFRKINMVSNDDMTDDVECEICGLKAKRFMTTLKFDGRISYKKIENCNPI